MNKKERLQEATILALQGKLQEVSTGKKILLYPDFKYQDRMDPEDITNQRGILFGYFNDEEIGCYETGFNSIQEMEKAVKNKEYMIDDFKDDEDFDSMSGDEWWDYIITTIEESYVDNDSYWSMFLINANQNYKILYCGNEEPVIENYKSQSIGNKLTIKTTKDGAPFFKFGSYKIYPVMVDNQIDMKNLEYWTVDDSNGNDYDMLEFEEKYDIENFRDLVTPDLQNNFNEIQIKYTQSVIQNADIKDEKTKQLFNKLIADNVLRSSYDINNIISFLDISDDDYNCLVNYLPYEFEKVIFGKTTNSYSLREIFGVDDCSDAIVTEIKSAASKLDNSTIVDLYKNASTLEDYDNTFAGYGVDHFIKLADYIYLLYKFNIHPKDFINIIKSNNITGVKYFKDILGDMMLTIYGQKTSINLNSKEDILEFFKSRVIKYKNNKE